MFSNLDRAALELHDERSDLVDWLRATDDELLAALNRYDLPFPNLDFLRWVEDNRPELLKSAIWARRLVAEIERS